MGLVVQQLLYLHMVLPWNVVHFGFITLLGCTRVLSAMLHSVKREVRVLIQLFSVSCIYALQTL